MFKRSFISVGGVPTKLISLDASAIDVSRKDSKKLILVVPGNPGLSSYYEDFMKTIHSRLGGKVPVWAVSHQGHEVPPSRDEANGGANGLPELKGNESLYSLAGQTQHKIRFLEDHVPADCQVTLIGHSIGCKMIADTMKHFRGSGRDLRAYFLFPVIEHMYETPNGWFTWIQCAYLRPLVILLTTVLTTLIPRSLLTRIISYHLRRGKSEPASACCVNATLDLLNPTVVGNATYLAYTELLTVREVDDQTIRDHVDKIRFYYGTIDNWCPLSFYESLKEKVPNMNAVVCEKKMEHAFVLSSSNEMGEIVAEWCSEDFL